MSGYRKEVDNLRSHINTLRAGLVVACIVILLLWRGWNNAPQTLTVDIPPDLSQGVRVTPGAKHPANIFAFTHYIWQQLHRWPNDGRTDYGANIYRLQAYFTPVFSASLTGDMEARSRAGELSNRIRTMRLSMDGAYEARRVDTLSATSWVVWLDEEIEETVNGVSIKCMVVRYPLRVVAFNADPERNPFGLAIAGYQNTPERVGDCPSR
ncbi:MAG: TIGR03746 family integrating conjugative element protein [Gammaproteobacteria bacterium]|nr:TIGR03746 family integrating conjugative element protein [Gammaproteobacteria bacterium]